MSAGSTPTGYASDKDIQPLLGGVSVNSSPPVGSTASDPRRFYVMAVFVLLTTNQCLLWFTFSSASTPGIAEYYGFPNSTDPSQPRGAREIDLLLAWGPIGGVAAFPVATWLLSRSKGVSRAMTTAAVLMVLCVVLRLVPTVSGDPTQGHWWLHLGQLFNAVAGPFIMAGCSAVSALWFPPSQRATATAVAYCGGSIGGALGFAFGPLIVADSAANTPMLLYVEAAMALVPCSCCLVFLPAAPRSPSSSALAAAAPSPPGLRAWWQRLVRAVSNRSMFVLALITGVQAGVNSGWGAMIPQAVAPPAFSTGTAGLAGLLNGLSQLGGNLVGGRIADRLFRRRYKRMLLIAFGLNAVALTGYALTLPSLFDPSAALLPSDAVAVVVWCTASGFLQGCADPVLFELSAEITYDGVAGGEGLSAGLIVLLWKYAVLPPCLTVFPWN